MMPGGNNLIPGKLRSLVFRTLVAGTRTALFRGPATGDGYYEEQQYDFRFHSRKIVKAYRGTKYKLKLTSGNSFR